MVTKERLKKSIHLRWGQNNPPALLPYFQPFKNYKIVHLVWLPLPRHTFHTVPYKQWKVGHNRLHSSPAAPASPVWSHLPPVRALKVLSLLVPRPHCPTTLGAIDRGQRPRWPQQDDRWAPSPRFPLLRNRGRLPLQECHCAERAQEQQGGRTTWSRCRVAPWHSATHRSYHSSLTSLTSRCPLSSWDWGLVLIYCSTLSTDRSFSTCKIHYTRNFPECAKYMWLFKKIVK